LRIATHLTYRDATGLGAYDCTIVDGHGTRVAAAAMTVYEPEDFAQFIYNQKNGKER
jgi:predicted hotdog family 3-hydroxylacyl-ACP dehydratase